MAKSEPPASFQRAIQHHQAGRLPAAEALYREILAREPDCVEALHLLGVIAHQSGRHEVAVGLMERAMVLAPHNPTIRSNLGEACRHRGRFAEAEAQLRHALALQPGLPDAHNNLGNTLTDQGRLDEALACFRRAVALRPEYAEAHYNLGNLLQQQVQLDQALVSFRLALALHPGFSQVHNNLSEIFLAQGCFDEARLCCQRALTLQPNFAGAHNNLGNVLKAQGQPDAALTCLRQAVMLQPDLAEAHGNLGLIMQEQGRLDEALACCQRALALRPDLAKAHNNLGNVLRDRAQLDGALACFERALALSPTFAEAHSNRGLVLAERNLLDDALASLRQALVLQPDLADAHNNLGGVFKPRGELDEALVCYRRALALKPESADVHSNIILALHYRCGHEAAPIAAELRRWQEQHARPLAKAIRPHPHDRSPDRRLRIGYVSADFRSHPVGWFLGPLLAAHDRQACAVFCYSNGHQIDDVTAQLRGQAEGWREIAGHTDQQVADQVRADRIDILVDLALHTAKNRLLVFARKPAPVQVSYLGYPGLTGLDTVDYRLTDRYLDPPSQDPPPGAEQPIRLPDTYWCYEPVVYPAPAIAPLPALTNGFVTFGCLNNFCKITPATLAAWCRLLAAVPTARLLLHAQPGAHRLRVATFAAANAVDPQRICFVDRLPEAQYLQTYQAMDIALDPFPFPGGTTTCDALWMGVPVITLAGATPVTRGGLSVLANVGLTELVAYSVDSYFEKALALARDLPRLAALRAGLRERMQRSPLMDAPRFARQVEAAYRTMWQRWCAQPAPPSAPLS